MAALLISGLTAGFIYTLVGAGLWIVWRYAGVANFAHSEAAMIAAFTAHAAVPHAGWPAALAAAAAVAVTAMAVLGLLAHGGGQRSIAVTFAGMLTLRGVATLIWGDEPARWSGPWQQALWPDAPAGLTWLALGTALLASGVVAALGLWLQRSGTGLRLRAAASDPGLAALTGTRPGKVRGIAWCAGGLLAVPAGIAASLAGLLEPAFMADWTLPAFVLVLAVPGLHPWALLPAGSVLGVAEQLLSRLAPPGARDLLLLAALAFLIRRQARATEEPA